MKIIKATEIHIPIIQEIAIPTWEIAYKDILTKEQLSYMLDMMYSTKSLHQQLTTFNHIFLLAYDHNTPVGFVSFEVEEKKVKLHKLYVLPQHQGKKIGEILINEVTKNTVNAEKPVITLNVNRYNKALSFYKREGFEIVNEVDIEIGNGYLMEDYVLEKRV